MIFFRLSSWCWVLLSSRRGSYWGSCIYFSRLWVHCSLGKPALGYPLHLLHDSGSWQIPWNILFEASLNFLHWGSVCFHPRYPSSVVSLSLFPGGDDAILKWDHFLESLMISLVSISVVITNREHCWWFFISPAWLWKQFFSKKTIPLYALYYPGSEYDSPFSRGHVLYWV